MSLATLARLPLHKLTTSTVMAVLFGYRPKQFDIPFAQAWQHKCRRRIHLAGDATFY